MQPVFEQIAAVAASDSTVLLIGESGTGKELAARAIHWNGSRRARAFVAVNCAAIPDNLLESELFGHERGAFTGAERRRRGLFELASGGTIFLDEIGDLSRECQIKLLQVVEEGRFRRLGSDRDLESSARVMTATHQDLWSM